MQHESLKFFDQFLELFLLVPKHCHESKDAGKQLLTMSLGARLKAEIHETKVIFKHKRFLGFDNVYQHFLHGFSSLTASLTSVLKKAPKRLVF